jgi:hypothetical protein
MDIGARRAPQFSVLGSLFQRAEKALQRHFAASWGQLRKDARPEAGGAPEPVPLVRRLPLAVFRWHRSPRGVGAHHPHDAGEHGPVVVARPPRCRLLGREQRRDAVPFAVGQPCLGRCGRRCGAGGWCGRLVQRTPRGVAAGRNRLVTASPAGPSKAERPLLRGFAHGEDQPTHLRHREWDQAGVGAPFCPRSSCCAAWRRTTR